MIESLPEACYHYYVRNPVSGIEYCNRCGSIKEEIGHTPPCDSCGKPKADHFRRGKDFVCDKRGNTYRLSED